MRLIFALYLLTTSIVPCLSSHQVCHTPRPKQYHSALTQGGLSEHYHRRYRYSAVAQQKQEAVEQQRQAELEQIRQETADRLRQARQSFCSHRENNTRSPYMYYSDDDDEEEEEDEDACQPTTLAGSKSAAQTEAIMSDNEWEDLLDVLAQLSS